MNDFEYRNLRQKGELDFRSVDHDSVLANMLSDDFSSIMNFPKRKLEEIKRYQIEKLSKLVDYAYMNIPLYKKKYDTIDYKLGSIKTFDDFERLPILYKDELINEFPHGIVKKIEDYKYSTRSSGSSGKFVTLAVDLDAIYIDTLHGIRQFCLQSNFQYKKQDKVLFIYTCPWWISSINREFKLDYLPTTTSHKEALKYIEKTRPFIISTYPTYLQKLCECNIKLCDYGVEYIIVHSEQSTKKMRNDIADTLGVKVFDEYSSEELTRIALECNNGNYHLEEDSCYVEVIDLETKQKVENGTGIVVGTNLLNMATPIIRYYQGDVVKIESIKKCSCGHNGRVLTEVKGREMDCIMSDKEKIPASAFMDLAYNWFLTNKVPIQGMRYQIVQTSNKEVSVYLAEGLYKLTKADLEEIKKSLYSLISKNIKVNVKYTDKFIYKSNKFKPVINLIGNSK